MAIDCPSVQFFLRLVFDGRQVKILRQGPTFLRFSFSQTVAVAQNGRAGAKFVAVSRLSRADMV